MNPVKRFKRWRYNRRDRKERPMQLLENMSAMLGSIAGDMGSVVAGMERFGAITNPHPHRADFDPILHVHTSARGRGVRVCCQCHTPHENPQVIFCEECGTEGQFCERRVR